MKTTTANGTRHDSYCGCFEAALGSIIGFGVGLSPYVTTEEPWQRWDSMTALLGYALFGAVGGKLAGLVHGAVRNRRQQV